MKVKESRAVRNHAAHIAVGVDTDGIKHVLGIWVQTTEGAKFWVGLHVPGTDGNDNAGDTYLVLAKPKLPMELRAHAAN